MSLVTLDSGDPTPIYAQLDRGFRAAIATNRLRPGDQLPTVRQLAVDLQINANTVARVYAELERAGVIETKRGVGSFITATPAQAPATRAGTPTARLPHARARRSRRRRVHHRRSDGGVSHLSTKRRMNGPCGVRSSFGGCRTKG